MWSYAEKIAVMFLITTEKTYKKYTKNRFFLHMDNWIYTLYSTVTTLNVCAVQCSSFLKNVIGEIVFAQ